MRSTYSDAMRRGVFPHEGGYSNHPSDPGGPTNWGITIIDARKYWKPNATAADMRAMPREVAEDIYARHYAAPLCYDDLPAGVDYTVLDYGINSGIGRAGKVLRRACGLTDADWRVTDEVLRAVAKREPAALINAICDERLHFLKSLKTWPVFGAGWARRVDEVRATALGMAEVAANETVPSTGAQKGTAGAIAAAGAAAAHQAHFAGAKPAVVGAIVIVTIMLALGGWFAWRWHQRRQQLARE